MTARLTIAAARPGMRDRHGYLRWTPTSCRRCGYERADCTCLGGFAAPASEPTLAALLAERAPEFLAAVREWHATFASASVPRIDRALLSAIERAGLIAQEPRTPLPAMYCGADAFTEIQQEATRDAG